MKAVCSLFVWIGILATCTALHGAQAEVVRADDRTVEVGMGADRGVLVGMVADVYRQAEPIIHPVTRENLGSPRVKIARIEIQKVEPTSAVGRYTVKYVPVMPGDVVEGLEVMPSAQEQVRAEVERAKAEIKALAQRLTEEVNASRKAVADLRATLRRISSSEKRLGSVVNAVKNMRERMVSIEARMVTLEDRQQAFIAQDSAEVKELGPSDMRELRVLRRSDDDAIYLKVGDRMYRLLLEEDRLVEEPRARTVSATEEELPPQVAGGTVSPVADDLFEEDLPPEEPSPWYLVYWWVAPLVGLLGAAGLFLLKMMKRQQQPAEEEIETDGGFPEAMDDEIADAFPEAEEIEIGSEEE